MRRRNLFCTNRRHNYKGILCTLRIPHEKQGKQRRKSNYVVRHRNKTIECLYAKACPVPCHGKIYDITRVYPPAMHVHSYGLCENHIRNCQKRGLELKTYNWGDRIASAITSLRVKLSSSLVCICIRWQRDFFPAIQLCLYLSNISIQRQRS